MNPISYSVVIATRNRPSALRLSIPRILDQSRPPAQLIVVDSSEDHGATVAAVRESLGDFAGDVQILKSLSGISLQRNTGLSLVQNPITFFPDDDSIWFSGVAEAMLKIYERDTDGKVAAVCGYESRTPPPDWKQSTGMSSYSMRRSHKLNQQISAYRTRFESRFFPDPARVLSHSFWPSQDALPEWVIKENIKLVEWMTGFRMSFRTDVIRKVGFDENLGRYSLFEDIDASFAVWQQGLVLAAKGASIYHYRSPEKRAPDRKMGTVQILNKAYIIAKHSKPGHEARRIFRRYARYKALLYMLGASNRDRRSRLLGLLDANRNVSPILKAFSTDALAAYKDAMQHCSDSRG